MATLSPVTLGTTITITFLGLLAIRPLLYKRFVSDKTSMLRARRAFFIEFCTCILAGILIFSYNRFVYGFPIYSFTSLIIGCIIVGFFIGLDASLFQERKVIREAMNKDISSPIPQYFFSMTKKFTFVAVSSTFFISLVIILLLARDVVWLTKVSQDEASIHQAQLSVAYEIFFTMAVLIVLMLNLIVSYSRNLKLLFNNQTRVLEQVSAGNLSQKVPVATYDEFGIIAGHTNTMIDGLRHRFELVSEMKLAEEVQQNLLPDKSPDFQGLQLSGISLYCDATGGDYFDYFKLSENKFGIVVADACGHGVGAALLMISVRAFLHTAVKNYSSPADLLTSINMYISRDCARSGRFTSMFFLEIDRKNASITWVRAGHEPALYYKSADKSFNYLNDRGLVLGIDDQVQYKNSSQSGLQENDIIFIGTDGIKESRNSSDEMFGQDRLEEIIRINDHRSAETIRDKIIKEVSLFRDTLPQEDDITLVVIKIKKTGIES